jgi:hypothetical protein
LGCWVCLQHWTKRSEKLLANKNPQNKKKDQSCKFFFSLLRLDKPKMGCNKFYVQCSALPLHTIKLPTVWQSSLSCKKSLTHSLTHSLPNKPNSSPHKSLHFCVPPSYFLLQPLAKQQLAIYPSKIHRVSSEVAPVAKNLLRSDEYHSPPPPPPPVAITVTPPHFKTYLKNPSPEFSPILCQSQL